MGGVALPCPAGTYGAQEGLQKLRDCTVCPAGRSLIATQIIRGRSTFCVLHIFSMFRDVDL